MSSVKLVGVPLLVCALSVSFGCLVIVGTMAYKKPRGEEPTEAETSLLVFPPLLTYAMLIVGLTVFGEANPSVDCYALFIAAMLGTGSTIAFCILTASWWGAFEHLFWIMGSTWVSVAVELATGLVGRFLRWLQG